MTKHLMTFIVTTAMMVCALTSWCAPGPSVSVQFRVLAMDSSGSEVSFPSGGRYTTLHAPPGSVGRPHNYTGPTPMGLYRSQTVDGKQQWTQVGQVLFPANGGGRYLVLLVTSNTGQIIGTAIPDNSSGFPDRHIRIFNATPITLNLDVNEDKNLSLKSGEFKVVNLGAAYRGDVYVWTLRNNERVDLTNNMFTNAAGVRRSVFLVMMNIQEVKSNPAAMPAIDMITFQELPDPPPARGGNQRTSGEQ